MEWIRDRLQAGPDRHGNVRKAAEEAGISTTTFYNACDRLDVERFELDGKKWLRLPPAEAADGPAEADTPATIPMVPRKKLFRGPEKLGYSELVAAS